MNPSAMEGADGDKMERGIKIVECMI